MSSTDQSERHDVESSITQADKGDGALDQFLKQVSYTFTTQLTMDPESRQDGNDHQPRQVFSGHYVPVAPTPLLIQSTSSIARDSLLSLNSTMLW